MLRQELQIQNERKLERMKICNNTIILFSQLIVGVREYNNSMDMQLDMEEHCKGNCFAINYEKLPDSRADGNFKYSLSSNQMRISPKKRFVNDEDINHQKGI